ncbi:MAG: DICT sensory domain-containing protein [Thermosynechococcaceae cyanobacterium]
MLDGSILQKLSVSHSPQQSQRRPLSLGVYYKNTLVALCHALEDYILECDSSPLVVAAFQLGKWYAQEAERYGTLAEKSSQIVIMAADDAGFAEHATSHKPNVTLVPLPPDDPVAHEWHLVIFAPTYAAMVLCQELSATDYGPSGPPQDDLQRKFYGFWTFETDLVAEAMDLAIAHIGRYNASLAADLTQQMQGLQANQATTAVQPLATVVSKVVTYLQRSQHGLGVSASDVYLDNNLLSNEVQAFLRMAQIIDLMSPENASGPVEVAALAEMMGQLLDLPGWQLKRLRLAGMLHRLGPLQQSDSLLSPSKPQVSTYPACPLTCALEPGAQALRTMPRLRAMAQIMTHQTEWWNGQGSPAGLVADDIPLESRILGLAISFQHLAGSLTPPADMEHWAAWATRLQEALTQCQQGSGDRWDPKLIELLTLLVSGMCQGLCLPIQATKFSNSQWLLDTPSASNAPLGRLSTDAGTESQPLQTPTELEHGN